MLFRNHKACDFIPYEFRTPSKILYSYWNKLFYFFDSLSEPLQSEPLARLSQLLVRNELTQKILLIKELKASSPDGKWPETIPGIESSVCSESYWIYRIKPDGTMCISMSLAPLSCEMTYRPAWCLPLQYCQQSQPAVIQKQ